MGRLITWVIIALPLVSCAASASFPYKYYSVHADSYAGTLQGPAAGDDIPFSNCKPTAGKAAPCLLMLKDSYLQLKADYQNMSLQLQCFQSGRTGC